jgi:hypothetical protein
MQHTVDTLLSMADSYADAERSDYLTGEGSSLWYRENLRTALTEALVQSTGCISNCDACTFHHQSPAQAGYCYMFYEEPQGVCGQWKDANPNISEYPEKDISAQPVREPLTDDVIFEIACGAADEMWPDIGGVGWTKEDANFYRIFCRKIEHVHGIGGYK